MPDISYLRIKPSRFTKDYTTRDASIVSALVYSPNANPVNMSNLEKLAIYLEQYILADYLYNANSDKRIKAYRDKVKNSFKIKKAEIIKNPSDKKKLSEENRFQESHINTLFEYFDNPDSVSSTRMTDLLTALDKCKFDRCSFLSNFYVPYFSQKLYDKEYYNPVILTPGHSFKSKKDSNNRTPIILYPVSFTKTTFRKVNINNSINNNKFYTYFLNMDFNNKSWQSVVDIIQKFNTTTAIESVSTLPGLLNRYLFNIHIPGIVDRNEAKKIFLSIFNYIDKYNELSTQNAHPEALANLMSVVFADDRCYYLLSKDPSLAASEAWKRCVDLSCFTKFGLEAAGDEGGSDNDDAGSDDTESGSDTGDSESSDSDTSDGDTDSEDFDEDAGGDDEAGDDDDFSFDDDDSGASDSESGDSSGDSDNEEEADPEDVNPLIQIIENESFDEYLERGSIEKKLLAIFRSPPPKLSANQLNTMKFWYIQWFPLVSVETTKMILGSLLDIEVDTDQ